MTQIYFRTIARPAYIPCSGCCIECEQGISRDQCVNRGRVRPVDDELMSMSEEWVLRTLGFHDIANANHGPSWLDYVATRQQTRRIFGVVDL